MREICCEERCGILGCCNRTLEGPLKKDEETEKEEAAGASARHKSSLSSTPHNSASAEKVGKRKGGGRSGQLLQCTSELQSTRESSCDSLPRQCRGGGLGLREKSDDSSTCRHTQDTQDSCSSTSTTASTRDKEGERGEPEARGGQEEVEEVEVEERGLLKGAWSRAIIHRSEAAGSFD